MGNAGNKGTVLVMDDQEMLREVAAAMLEDMGYRVLTAENGEQAVSTYRRALLDGESIQLLILDLTVPGGMGGAECARRIRQLDSGARMLVCSGHAADAILAQYPDHGFCGAISKPYVFEDLARAVDAALDFPVSG